MAEPLLKGLEVLVAEQARAAVAQLVERHAGEPGLVFGAAAASARTLNGAARTLMRLVAAATAIE